MIPTAVPVETLARANLVAAVAAVPAGIVEQLASAVLVEHTVLVQAAAAAAMLLLQAGKEAAVTP
jgi:hypothetical protein